MVLRFFFFFFFISCLFFSLSSINGQLKSKNKKTKQNREMKAIFHIIQRLKITELIYLQISNRRDGMNIHFFFFFGEKFTGDVLIPFTPLIKYSNFFLLQWLLPKSRNFLSSPHSKLS